MKDTVFTDPLSGGRPFTFDEKVAEVFPDMARRSIPGYELIINAIGRMAARHARDNSVIYDLGCSLGEASLAVRRAMPADRKVRLVAVDSSEAMIRRCSVIFSSYNSPVPAEAVLGDITRFRTPDASVVILNFVLQFIPREERDQILSRIWQDLLPGGILLISEKLKDPDPDAEALLTEEYFDFKRSNGYSELEISRKRTALEDVLLPDSWQELEARLHGAGFTRVQRWFQMYDFCSVMALKD